MCNSRLHFELRVNVVISGGRGGNKSGKHKWVPLDIDVKAARPGKHAAQHANRQDHGMTNLS